MTSSVLRECRSSAELSILHKASLFLAELQPLCTVLSLNWFPKRCSTALQCKSKSYCTCSTWEGSKVGTGKAVYKEMLLYRLGSVEQVKRLPVENRAQDKTSLFLPSHYFE